MIDPDYFNTPLALARVYYAFTQSPGGGGKYVPALCEALAHERGWDLGQYREAVEKEWAEEEARVKEAERKRKWVEQAKRARNYQKKYGVPPPAGG